MDTRAALYHRVSTVDQNPDAARFELRAAVERYGFTTALDIEETGSGANNQRPGLVQVLDAAQRGEIDVVLVWKLDRFGRSALDLLTNLRQLDAAGVRFIALTQGIDLRPGGDAGRWARGWRPSITSGRRGRSERATSMATADQR